MIKFMIGMFVGSTVGFFHSNAGCREREGRPL